MSKTGMPDRGRRTPRRAIRPWQALVTPLLAVVVFFGLLELVLALVGVQPALQSADPFVGFASEVPLFVEEIDPSGEPVLVTADNKLRFFNRQRFPRLKAPGTVRVFCLGGSTTYGRPYDDATSFSGWLRELLPVADPTRRWEVINAGGISYASYRVTRVMEELASYEPDLFVVYTGHNEFLEERTYGKVRDVPPVFRTAATVLARTRIWTALSSALDSLGALPGEEESKRVQLPGEVDPMLERFAGLDLYERDDELRRRIVEHYEVSLRRMVDIARSCGARLVFVAPASNLKDCSPFKSQHTAGLDAAAKQRTLDALAAAREAMNDSDPAAALVVLDRAIARDPRYAELHYRRGRVLLELERYGEAREAFKKARREDVCPLRALGSMRRALVEVARDTGTPWIDLRELIEEQMESEQDVSIAGEEYFLDHVHPTIEGHRLLALELIETMAETGIAQPGDDWTEETIAQVTSSVEESLDPVAHARAMANLSQVLFWAGKTEEALRPAERALSSGVQEPSIVVASARILGSAAAAEGEVARAVRYFRIALSALPASAETHFQVGLMYLNEPGRDLVAAAAHLFLTTALWPDNDLAYQTLGLAMAERGRYEIAFASLREARRLNPDNADAEWALARLGEILGPRARAVELPGVAVRSYPSGAPREVYQYEQDRAGRKIDHGIRTEWFEDGGLRRFVEFENGRRHGEEVTWNRTGQIASRVVYRHGEPVSADSDDEHDAHGDPTKD